MKTSRFSLPSSTSSLTLRVPSPQLSESFPTRAKRPPQMINLGRGATPITKGGENNGGGQALEAAPARPDTAPSTDKSPKPRSQSLSLAESPQQLHCVGDPEFNFSKPLGSNPSPILPASHPLPNLCKCGQLCPTPNHSFNPALRTAQPVCGKAKGVWGVGGLRIQGKALSSEAPRPAKE